VLFSFGSDFFVCYSILPGDAQDTPLPTMMSGVQSFVSVAVEGHTFALYRRVDKINYRFILSAVKILSASSRNGNCHILVYAYIAPIHTWATPILQLGIPCLSKTIFIIVLSTVLVVKKLPADMKPLGL